MDWARAIERNSDALKAIVAVMFAALAIEGGGGGARIPRALYSAVLGVLRPAESAVRRLIVIAARGLVVKSAPARAMPAESIGRGQARRLSFPLFDPRKRFAHERRETGPRAVPRIRIFGGDPVVAAMWPAPPAAAAPVPPDDGCIDAGRLSLRLQALRSALENLPRQARRLVRLRARREKMPGLRPTSPLRPGPPPGYRRKPVHAVDHVLAECHGLAFDALAPDTS